MSASEGDVMLSVDRNEAESKLRERISNGNDLLDRVQQLRDPLLRPLSGLTRLRPDQPLIPEDEFKDLHDEYRTWNELNRRILSRLFSDESIANSYGYRGAISLPRSFGERIEALSDELREDIRRLSSIAEQLPDFAVTKAEGSEESHQVRNSVFVIHGHDRAAALELKSLLKDEFDLDAVLMDEKPHEGMTTLIAKFEREAEGCGFAIALFTPDDFVRKGDMEHAQMRPNVLFELGWFCGHLGREKACILYKEGTEIPSDLLGVGYYKFHNSPEERLRQLREELRKAGVLGDQ